MNWLKAASTTWQLSIHDVMPETLTRVEQLFVHCLQSAGRAPALLVVPGRHWKDDDLLRLFQLVDLGATLVAHGWLHQVNRHAITRPAARLHAATISRNAGEHLDLTPAQITERMCQSYQWFTEHYLPQPELYVPPAWALGATTLSDLQQTPFRVVETLFGFTDLVTGDFIYSPLLGYEADTLGRALALRSWNVTNAIIAKLRPEAPLRLCIHPYDESYKLAKKLYKDLQTALPARHLKQRPNGPLDSQTV